MIRVREIRENPTDVSTALQTVSLGLKADACGHERFDVTLTLSFGTPGRLACSS